MDEEVGALVLSMVKSLDYGTAIELAFKYRWRNVLNRLLKMYLVIDRNTSKIFHKGTLSINEGEYLDIDIGKLFLNYNESRRGESDIIISDSICVYPLVTNIDASEILLFEIRTISGESDIEMLMDTCNAKFEFPADMCDSIGRDIRCIDARFLVSCLVIAASESCRLNNLDG
ncbi:hypothetical protein AX774_g6879 [Zancudomyces culisetae]|uniref:Uncharacterized protein n=1 Tax=Zancudomyces culisetae TaxID=1213189 RepID=A0A1R1PFK0_ZANCU|nr:hypothetical protein AX774_g6879 [Zancudomyces culisetae]|eukprot:OMH79699.1 hypothetical protein AX774_g6879 [Zancudomyces culisetae]